MHALLAWLRVALTTSVQAVVFTMLTIDQFESINLSQSQKELQANIHEVS